MSKPPPEPRKASSKRRRAPDEGDRALESLAASHDALAEAQRIAHVGSWSWNISSGSLDWSDETFRIFGFEPGAFDATYEGFLGFIHPDDREAVERAVSEAMSGDGHYRIEHRVVRPKGEERVVHERGEVTFDQAGKPARMIGTVQDVTGATRLREELEHSEIFNRLLIDACPEAIVLFDENGMITYVNAAAEALGGYSLEESQGTSIFHYTDDLERSAAALEHLVGGGSVRDVEFTVKAKDGRKVDVALNATKLVDDKGESRGILLVARDIGERKRMKEALSQSQAYNRGLIEASADGLLTIDRAGVITDVNEQMCVLTGHSREEMIGSEFALHCLDPEKAREGVRRTFEEGAVGDYVLTLAHGQAEAREFSFNATLYQDEEGEVAGIFASARDITLRRHAERALDAERTRFNDILEMLPAYLVLLTPDYHVPFANRFFRERFGEAKGRRCYEYLFGRTEPCEICETYTVLKTGAPHRWEWLGPDGRNYDIYDFPFTDADGSPLIMEMGIDVTEQKRLENEMRDAHLYTRSLIEAALDAQMTTDITGAITDVNAEMEKLTGRSRQELIGTRLRQYTTDPARAAAGIERVLRDGIVRDFELTIEAKDGRQTDVAFHATTYFDQQGELRGIFASARDMTERKRFEEERQVARFFDSALDLAGIANLDGYFVRVNPAFEQTLGWTAEEICSSPFLDFVHPDDRERTLAEFARQAGKGIPAFNFENRYRCKDGSFRWLRWRTAPASETGLIYTSARDISEEKRRDEERERELTRIRALGEISSGLVAATTPWGISEVFFAIALPALGATAGTLGMVSSERARFETRMTGFPAEIDERFSERPIDCAFPSGVCATTGQELWFESMAEIEAKYPVAAETLAHTGIEASLYLPLLAGGETIACLVAHFPDIRSFGEEDKTFARAIAAQCAQALERVRLSEQRERALQRTQALQEVSAGLAAVTEPADVLRVIFDRAFVALGAEGGSIGLLDPERGDLAVTHVGLGSEAAESYGRLELDSPLPGPVSVRENRPLWV
jgi:PAS domain S-box-containing protein